MSMDAKENEGAPRALGDAQRVRFENNSKLDETEEERMRRGSVSEELKKQIAARGMFGRAAVSLGYATNRSFNRSRSEASIFRPERAIPTGEEGDQEEVDENPSMTLWQSGYTTLSRVKSTSSVISGLNDDVLRAGWRRNEPGPFWEQSHELEPDRKAVVNIPEETEGDGFDVDEMDFDDPPTDESVTRSNEFADLIEDQPNSEMMSQEAGDQLGAFPPKSSKHPIRSITKRQLNKTQSMPVGGTFANRPEQPKYYRDFENFMSMDVEF